MNCADNYIQTCRTSDSEMEEENTLGFGKKRRKGGMRWTHSKKRSSSSTKIITDGKKEEPWENMLENIYSNIGEAGAYSSTPSKLQKILLEKHNVHVSLRKIKNWLNSKYSHSLHMKANLSFKRNQIIATDIDEQWQGDLFFLEEFKRSNKGFIGGLLIIDIVSRKMFVELIKNKTGPQTTEAFKTILDRSKPRKPLRLQTDKGTEFLNQTFQNFLKQNNIDFFTSHSDHKAAIAERAIKTLKTLIYKYADENHTLTYYDKIQDLVDTYNNTFHSSIKMAPSEVKKENVGNVLENLYGHLWKSGDRIKLRKPKFKSGDFVRLSKIHDQTFKKGYKGHWTEEMFQVDKIKNSLPYYTYGIKDLNGKEILGSYYEEELQKIQKLDFSKQHWKVEKIIEERATKSGRREYLVKWENYDSSFNSWVSENKIKTITGGLKAV